MDGRSVIEMILAPTLFGIGYLVKWRMERKGVFTEIDFQNQLLTLYERLKASDLTPAQFERFRAGIEQRARIPRGDMNFDLLDLNEVTVTVDEISVPEKSLPTHYDSPEFASTVGEEVVIFETPLAVLGSGEDDMAEEKSMADIAAEIRKAIESAQRRVDLATIQLTERRDGEELAAFEEESEAFLSYMRAAAERSSLEQEMGSLRVVAYLSTVSSLLRTRADDLEKSVKSELRRDADREEIGRNREAENRTPP
jgi:hypothetical protein